MPTQDRRRALTPEDARRVFAAAADGAAGETGLGLEVELFPLGPAPALRRTLIHGDGGLLAHLRAAVQIRASMDPGESVTDGGWRALGDRGGRLSFEPGGQLEASTCYRSEPAEAMAAATALTTQIADALEPAGIQLAAAGIDMWDPGAAPQQLAGPRYPAMAAALAARGAAGATMMRDTCALQLNLDLDAGAEADARWQVTNLLGPVATATFACSPSRDGRVRSRRSLAWQALDPTRTGFVHDRPGVRLADELERFALDADVLFVAGPATTTPMRPGWRFRDWLRHGHRRLGWPTVDDLTTHLTTLFPEVRPRGHLEIRSIDAVPARWRRAVVTLYLGATYDARARDRILEVLTGRPTSLPEQLRGAAKTGLADPARCALAVEVWSFALEGAARLPASAVAPEDLAAAGAFVDRFTMRGRCPGDELLETLRHGRAAALAWAAEPGAARQKVAR